jgi:hypothetical protein
LHIYLVSLKNWKQLKKKYIKFNLKSKSEQIDCSLNSGALNESSRNNNNNNAKNGHEIDSDRFINYIKSILKRDLTIPVIKFVIKLVLLLKKLILILKKWQ